jgi:hypothetical protein
MTSTRFALLALLLAACGGTGHGDRDLGFGPDVDQKAAADDLPLVETACVTNDDCSSASEVCAYPLADGCAAKGHCVPVATPTCASIVELCGCDGTVVPGGSCFYDPGYAGGPTTGGAEPACGDGGVSN